MSRKKKIEVNLGYACNNECKFCLNNFPIEKRKFIPFQTAAEKIKEFKNKGYEILGFLGGEPTIYPKIISLLKLSKDIGYKRVDLVSNGRRYADFNFSQEVSQSANVRFYLSIHSCREEIEDYLTSRKNSFREKIQGLKNLIFLKKRGLIKENIFIDTVITKPNYKTLPGIILFYFRNFRIKNFSFKFVRPQGKALKNFEKIVPEYSNVLPYLKKAFLLAKTLKINFSVSNFPFCLLKKAKIDKECLGELRNNEFERKAWNLYEKNKEFEVANREKKWIACLEECQKCVYNGICPGIWKKYLKHFPLPKIKAIHQWK